jgi:hypothetical protein
MAARLSGGAPKGVAARSSAAVGGGSSGQALEGRASPRETRPDLSLDPGRGWKGTPLAPPQAVRRERSTSKALPTTSQRSEGQLNPMRARRRVRPRGRHERDRKVAAPAGGRSPIP